VTKAFVPTLLAQQSGRIIMIASIASKMGAPYIAAYAASKHGVLGLTRALAAELQPYNITVNAVCPGYVDTPMTDTNITNIVAKTGLSTEKVRASMANTSPQQRLIAPEEVAAAVLFLVQDINRGITGQALNIDGGGIMS
jgi:NAD(P)-dependent dehydrogenase (short-subunit alcohol dehydrogenase family)